MTSDAFRRSRICCITSRSVEGKAQPGTEVAALFSSLIETARLCGEDPGDYLLRAALAAIEQPGTVTLPNSFD